MATQVFEFLLHVLVGDLGKPRRRWTRRSGQSSKAGTTLAVEDQLPPWGRSMSGISVIPTVGWSHGAQVALDGVGVVAGQDLLTMPTAARPKRWSMMRGNARGPYGSRGCWTCPAISLYALSISDSEPSKGTSTVRTNLGGLEGFDGALHVRTPVVYE